jgi:aminoglycoside phosphotransferase (APT) family kinase protein
VEREIAALPQLAPLLPAPVPVPVFVGGPSGAFPWPFFGAELLPGREPERGAPPERARGALAGELGRFLRALHDPALAQAVDPGRELPVDLNHRADMALRVPKTREWLASVAKLGIWRAPRGVERLLSDALELEPPEAAAIVHGDLHFRHVLVDGGGRLAGVIDWGDLCRADPSVDLALVWALLPRESRDAFLEAYGPVSGERLLRARVLALCLCAALAAYGRHEALPGVEGEALDGLRRAAES